MNIYSYSCQWCFYGAPLVPSSVNNNDESNAGSLHTAKKKGGQYQRPGETHGFWVAPSVVHSTASGTPGSCVNIRIVLP